MKDLQIGDVIKIYIPGELSTRQVRIQHIPLHQGQPWICETLDRQRVTINTNSPITRIT